MGNRASQSAEHIIAKDTEREVQRDERVKLALATAERRPMGRRLAKLVAAVRGEAHVAPPAALTSGIRSEQVRVKRARLGAVQACESCGFQMPDPSLMNLHHVRRVADGGDNSPENVALLCPNCHITAHWLMRTWDFASREEMFAELQKTRLGS